MLVSNSGAFGSGQPCFGLGVTSKAPHSNSRRKRGAFDVRPSPEHGWSGPKARLFEASMRYIHSPTEL